MVTGGTSPKDASEARRDLAGTVRRLAVATVASDLGDDALSGAAAAVRSAVRRLRAAAGAEPRRRDVPDPSGPLQALFPRSPVAGLENPVAPPVRLWREGGGLAGEAWFDHTYEGPPTCVHGGVIAMVAEHMLGVAVLLAGHPSTTGTFRVRYRRPTPLRELVQLSARCTGAEGGVVRAVAAVRHDGAVTAEATGVFPADGPGPAGPA